MEAEVGVSINAIAAAVWTGEASHESGHKSGPDGSESRTAFLKRRHQGDLFVKQPTVSLVSSLTCLLLMARAIAALLKDVSSGGRRQPLLHVGERASKTIRKRCYPGCPGTGPLLRRCQPIMRKGAWETDEAYL